jgi:hypothetical protein
MRLPLNQVDFRSAFVAGRVPLDPWEDVFVPEKIQPHPRSVLRTWALMVRQFALRPPRADGYTALLAESLRSCP